MILSSHLQLLDELVWTWVEYDDGSSTITLEDLYSLLKRVGLPLGLPESATHDQVAEFASDLKVTLKKGRALFQTTAFELVRKKCESFIPPCR